MENGKKFSNNFRGDDIGRDRSYSKRTTNGEDQESYDPDYQKFCQIFIKDAQIIPICDFSINMFHCWFDNLRTAKKSISVEWTGNTYRHTIAFERSRGKTKQLVRIVGNGSNKKSQLYNIVCKLNGVTNFQMDAGKDGENDSTEIVASNTKVVIEDDESAFGTSELMGVLPKLSSTAPSHEMPSITDRFEIFENGTITVGTDVGIFKELPKALFSDSKKTSANLTLFRNFIYSELELEIRVIVNIPKFLQGKVAVSFFPDPHDQIGELYRSYNSLVQREHAIVDFAANNEVTLRVPQNIRRTFIRNVQHESAIPGIAYANLAELQIVSLAPFRSGINQPQTIPYQLLYRFTKAKFYGMSYAVNLQMDEMVDLASAIYPPLGKAEKLLKRVGFIGNQDKPYFDKTDVFVPTPRRNFSAGTGLSDSIPMTFDHKSTVTTLAEYINSGDPKDMVSIAKIPGIIARPEWTTSHGHGDVLWEWVVFPGDRVGFEMAHGPNRADPKRPTPINFASSQYAFWRGSIKLRFEFVGTIFHTGTVQFEVSYNRYGNMDENSSVYTTTFSLGLDREVEVGVPYIYDTPWRRTSSQVQWPSPYVDAVDCGGFGTLTCDDLLSAAQPSPFSTEFISNTRVTVRVINTLTPIDNVSKTVDILVYISGGEDFELMGIVPNFFTRPSYLYTDKSDTDSGALMPFKEFPVFDNIPGANQVPNTEKVPRIKTGSSGKKTQTIYKVPHKSIVENGLKTGYYRLITKDNKKISKVFKKYTPRPQTFGSHKYESDFRHFHSTDDCTNLKTIMRRNVLLGIIMVEKRIIKDKKCFAQYPYGQDTVDVWGVGLNTFFMPVYLPAHGIPNEAFNSVRGSGLATIPSLFRHWRGSMRYTFVLASNTQATVTFSYLPNMGTTHFGNKPRMLVLNDINGGDKAWSGNHYLTSETHHVGSLGLPTEIMIPSVNKSISLTVPFDVMFNRCVTNQLLQRGNGSTLGRVTGREQPTFHSGHILIECSEDVSLEVYQSIGDDLELMNFVGTMEYLQGMNYTIPDSFYRDTKNEDFKSVDFQINCISGDTKCNIPRVEYQMFGLKLGIDESLNSQLDRVQHGIATVVSDSNRISKQVEETVGVAKETSKTLSTGVDNLSELVRETKQEFGEKIDKMEEHFKKIGENFEMGRQTMEGLGGSVKSFLDSITPMVDSTKKFFSKDAMAQNAYNYSRDFLFDLVILLRNFDYMNFGIMFMKYVAKVLNIGIEKTLEYGMELGKIVAEKLGFRTREQFSGRESGAGSIFGLFCVIISTLLKLGLSKEKKFYDYGSKWMDFALDPKSFQYANGLITFVEKVFKLFQNSVEYCLRYTNTEDSVRDILKKLGPEIEKFVLDVDTLTNPANIRILHRPDIKARIWKNFLFAKYLSQKLATISSNQAVGVLMKYVNKINSFCEKNWSNMACNPVRYEPRVYCIAGGSNIGKSYMSNELIMDLLTNIGYKRIGSNPIFTRAPGRKHWDGFGLQHMCVIFDDWMNLSNAEQVVEQIADLYELKSTCDFIPAMAAVEEKGIRANPKLIVLLTNDPFPDNSVNAVCPKQEAVWRRRDKLIWGRLRRQFEGVELHQNPQLLANYDHLEFQFGDPKLKKPEPNEGHWLSYSEMRKLLIEDFVQYNINEMANVQKRLANLCADLPDYLRDLVDPMEMYNLRTFEMELKDENFDEKYPSDELERHVENCLKQLTELKSQNPNVNHEGPKISVANLTPVEGTSHSFKPMVPREDHLDYMKQFLGDIGNEKNYDKMVKISFDDGLRRVEAEITVLEMRHILRFYCGEYGNRYSDIVIHHIMRQKRSSVPFIEHYCPKCYAERCSMRAIGEFRVSTFVSIAELSRTVNCAVHWGEKPTIACYDIMLAKRESVGVIECLDMLESGFAEYYLEKVQPSYSEVFRFLLMARDVSEAMYMEVKQSRELFVESIPQLYDLLPTLHNPRYVFRAELIKPFEEFGDTFYSAQFLGTLLEFGVLGLSDIRIMIYEVELALNENDFKDEWIGVDLPSRKLNSIYLEHLGRDLKLPKPIEVVETNDEQFPSFLFEGYNEKPELTRCMFLDEYNKRTVEADKWLLDFVRERENGNKVKKRREPVTDMESIEQLLSLLQAGGEFKDDYPIFDTEIELVDGEKRFVSSFYKSPLTKINVETCSVCDHCKKRALFQFGNKQHHVCIGCWKDESVCDYCMSHSIKNDQFYLAGFLVPMVMYLAAPERGWLRRIISFLIGFGGYYAVYYFVKALFSVFGKVVGGLWNVFGLFGFFATNVNTELTFENFNEGMFDQYVLTQLYEEESCFHEVLVNLSPSEVTCRSERWHWGEDGNESVSHYICRKNCYLGTRTGLNKYTTWCKAWHSNMRMVLIPICMHQPDSVIAERVPVWTLAFDGSVLREYKIGRKMNENMLGTVYQMLGYKTGMFMGANPTSSWLKILLSCALSLITVIGAVRGIYELVKFGIGKMSGKKDEQSGNAGYSRSTSTKHFSRKTKPNVKTKVSGFGQEQNQDVYFESLVKKIYRNQILVVFEDSCGNRLPQTMALTGIRNRIAVLPRHFYQEMKKFATTGAGYTMYLLEPNNPAIKTRTYVFSEQDFLVADDSDICLMKMPKTVQEFVNILPYFQTAEDCDKVLPSSGVLLRCPSYNTRNIREIQTRIYGYEKGLKMENGQEYCDVLKHGHSENGACGSLLLKMKSTRPIIGIHFAGTGQECWMPRGFCVPLSQATFESVDFITGGIKSEEELEITYPVEDAKISLDPDMVELQTLFAHEKEIHLATKTKIIPSMCHYYDGEAKTRPCFLSKLDEGYPHEKSPLVAGIEKHGILTKNFATHEVNEVRDILYESKYRGMKPLIAEPRRLTAAEAIRGFEIDGYDPLRLNTSAGYPFVFKDKKQKRDYITVTDDHEIEKRRVFVTREMAEHLKFTEMQRLSGERPMLPFVDENKDERKTFKKVYKLGGTRVFCMSPISNTVWGRANFLHFAAAYKANRLNLQHAVGISREGPQWGELAKRLLNNSELIVTLDYSNFGPGYNAMVNAAGHDIVTRWTKQYVSGVSDVEMEILGEEHYNSIHIAGDLVYKQMSGGPSGDALTVVKNGLVNELYILLAWRGLSMEYNVEFENSMYTDYFNKVVLITYGDDAIISIKPDVIQWFNGETISEYFARYNIVATDAEKSGKIVKYRTLEESTFLKSGFKRHPIHAGEWSAPLDEISISECPRWCFVSENHELATQVNCEQGLRLAYGHGREFFMKFREKVNSAMVEFDLPPLLLTWEELDRNFFPMYYSETGVVLQSVRNVGDPHIHQCIKCGWEYNHYHDFGYKNHSQRPNQCPNPSCVWYHKGDNPTFSHLLSWND